MTLYFKYSQTIVGTQTKVDGNPHDYNFSPQKGKIWSYEGPVVTHILREKSDTAENYSGNFTGSTGDEEIFEANKFGAKSEQIIEIDGVKRQALLDLVFSVKYGGEIYEIAVVDVDLNNGDDVQDTGEDGYYLSVTSRKVVWLFSKQFWLQFVPVLHHLQGRLAGDG